MSKLSDIYTITSIEQVPSILKQLNLLQLHYQMIEKQLKSQICHPNMEYLVEIISSLCCALDLLNQLEAQLILSLKQIDPNILKISADQFYSYLINHKWLLVYNLLGELVTNLDNANQITSYGITLYDHIGITEIRFLIDV